MGSKVFRTKFVKDCILKLGCTYILIAILLFIFVDYKISEGKWWADGFTFAMSDKFAFIVLLSSIILLGYGIFTWFTCIISFVLQANYSKETRFFSLVYLLVAPCFAAIITSEIYEALLANPFGDYKP